MALGFDHAFLVRFPFPLKNKLIKWLSIFILQNWKLEANIYISLGVLLSTKWENLN
jgi:hypothetical protein